MKALKAKPVEKAAPAPAAAAPKAAPTPAKPMGPNDYMVIGLARIDDRLIHGQVAHPLDQRNQCLPYYCC